MTDFSFDDFSPESEPEYEVTLDQITQDANEAVEILGFIKDLELQVKELNERLRHLTEKRIPFAMTEIGMSEFKMNDGTKIKVKEDIQAPQLDERKEFYAFAKQYLADNDALDLLKTDVSLQFSKGSHNEVLNLVAELKEKGYDPIVIDKVLAQTYKKFGRELLDDYNDAIKHGRPAEEPPFKELGMFKTVKADFVVPKK